MRYATKALRKATLMQRLPVYLREPLPAPDPRDASAAACEREHWERVPPGDGARPLKARRPPADLDAQRACEIYRRAWAFGADIPALAREYGIHDSTVRAIREGRIWREATGFGQDRQAESVQAPPTDLTLDVQSAGERSPVRASPVERSQILAGISRVSSCYIPILDADGNIRP